MRIDHTPALEYLFLAVNAATYRKPSTAEAGGGGEENRGLYAPTGENHSLARASHALVRGCLEGMRLVSMEAEDDDDHNGEARHADEERRFRFENFDLGSESNSVEDTMEDTVKEGEDP
jgi:hypothetical protein